MIASELAPKTSGAVVIDADRLWSKLPEYEELAKEDWKTAGDRTYAESPVLQRRGFGRGCGTETGHHFKVRNEHSGDVASILAHDGYEVSVDCVDCSPDEARERINKRANANPTPEDNLWCSPQRSEFPDKFDYKRGCGCIWATAEERRLITSGTSLPIYAAESQRRIVAIRIQKDVPLYPSNALRC